MIKGRVRTGVNDRYAHAKGAEAYCGLLQVIVDCTTRGGRRYIGSGKDLFSCEGKVLLGKSGTTVSRPPTEGRGELALHVKASFFLANLDQSVARHTRPPPERGELALPPPTDLGGRPTGA